MKSKFRLIEDAVEMAGLDEEFDDLIESLRTVARAAHGVRSTFVTDETAWRQLLEALDALPRWVLESEE